MAGTKDWRAGARTARTGIENGLGSSQEQELKQELSYEQRIKKKTIKHWGGFINKISANIFSMIKLAFFSFYKPRIKINESGAKKTSFS